MPPTSSTASSRCKAKKTADASPSISLTCLPTPRQGGSVSADAPPSSTSLLLLSVEELRQTPDNRLLSYLMDSYNAVRGITLRPLLSVMSSPSLTVTAAATAAPSTCYQTSPFTSEYVEELLTPRLLFSAIPDVSQLVACLLCDAVRLYRQQQQRVRSAEDSMDSPLNTSGSTGLLPSPRSVLESQQAIENDVLAGVVPLPFSPARCVDVLQCITRVFSQLFPSSSAFSPSVVATTLPLKRVAYLIERAAISHIFHYLLPHCATTSEDTQRALQSVFDAVRCATISSSSGTSLATTVGNANGAYSHPKTAGLNASVATCNEMAQLLIDILVATRGITSAQLTPLLEELAGASATLRQTSSKALSAKSLTDERRDGSTGLGSGNTAKKEGGDSLRSSQLQGGALITARVLLEQTDVALQPAIAAWATSNFDEGVEEFLAAGMVRDEEVDSENDDGDALRDFDDKELPQEQRQQQRTRDTLLSAQIRNNDTQLSRRSRGLRKVARVLEVLVALTELNVDLVDQVLPILAPHLEHPKADLRILLVRGFGAVFAANDAAVPTYAPIFVGSFLNRFLDVKPNIRMEALRISSTLVAQCAVRSGASYHLSSVNAEHPSSAESANCAAQQKRLWNAFRSCWDQLLTDPHVLVRKQAVCSVVEAALAAPLLFQQQQQHQTSTFLAETLGLRARDKNKRVRDAAVEGLTRLYHAYWLKWIPNAVLDAIRMDGGSSSSHVSATANTNNCNRGATAPGNVSVPAEAVVENLLPSPSAVLLLSPTSGSASGKQSTLTRWIGNDTAATAIHTLDTQASGGRPNLALFDFEQAHDDDTSLFKTESTWHDEEREKEEKDAMRGSEPVAGTTTAATAPGRISSSLHGNPLKSPATATYVDCLLHLCQSVDAAHFKQLLRLAEKKPQLRLAVQKLFEFHAAVRASNGDVKSAEGQQRINAIHRLLTFLQDTTGARKGEWDALFRAKDDTVRKSLLRACDSRHLDWVDVRDALLRSLKGRVGTDEFAFVKNALLPQLLFPTRPEHLHELMRRLRRSIYVSDRAEVVVDTPETVAVLRALLFLTAGTPSYHVLSVAGLAEALQAATKQSVAPPPLWCALLLQALQQWATAAAASATAGTPHGSDSTEKEVILIPREQRDAMVHALRTMALAALPMQQVAVNAKASEMTASSSSSKSSPLASLKQLAKQATRTLMALLQVPGFEQAAAVALQSLVDDLTYQLVNGRALTNDAKTVAWLASVQALSAHPRASTALRSVAAGPSTSAGAAKSSSAMPLESGEAQLPPMLPHLRALLLAAVSDVSDIAEQAKLVKPPSSIVPAANVNQKKDVMLSVALATRPPALTTTLSVAAAVVDGAAKAMTRLALGCNTADGVRAAAVSYVLETLLQAYKATAGMSCGRAGIFSIGNCQRRLAIEKQLVKLLATPTPDIAKEMAASVVFSVEQEAQLREVVQTKLASLLLQRSCDMRVAALLLLTAISEDAKSSYHRLRDLVESVGDRLREKQVSQGVSLSSPAALYCYWEYTIPFLVLFLAHHPYYAAEEAETQFLSFQRVWHLLVGELFRHGTQCAGFVTELLSRIKQSDDALDPSSNATRVICDLGSRVLLECLGQRRSRAEDLRRYPGAILLPSFFVVTSQSSPQKLLETVYLSDSVRVAPNAPFRLAGASTTGGERAAVSGSRGNSRQVTPRAASLTAFEGAASAEMEHPSEGHPLQQEQQRAPSTQRKRPRSPSVGSPPVSISPSVEPRELSEVVAVNSQSFRASSTLSSPRREWTEPALAESSATPLSSIVHANSTDNNNAIAKEDQEEKEKIQREAFQKEVVDEALKRLFTGLTRTQIAQLRWKVVLARLEEALQDAETEFESEQLQQQGQEGFAGPSTVSSPPTVIAVESNLEALLQYAKGQLRVWYNAAPA